MIGNINPAYFPPQPQVRTLDVGAARGLTSIGLQQAGYRVTALELDPELVKSMRAAPDAAGVEIVEGDALAMPFGDNTFERAVLLEVLEHIEDTDGLLREIARVMKPGGILCVGVPTGYTERIYWRLHPRYARNATHVKIFDLPDLRDHLARAGFHVRHTETKNFEPAVSWLFHALLRSDSDHTGAIHTHLWVDKILNRIFYSCGRIPGLRRAYDWLRSRIGKSWYLYCEKTA